MSIVNQAFKSIGWNSIGTFVRSIAGFIQLILISRYLDAGEIGSYSQFYVVVMLITILAGFGIIQSAISRTEFDETQQQQVHYSFVLLSIVVASLLFIAIPFISGFLKNPNLSELLILLCPIVLLMGAGQFSTMKCQKELQFGKLIICEALGAAAGTSVLFLSLYWQQGAVSCVYGLAANQVVRVSSLLILVRCPNFFVWRFSWQLAKEHFSYGSKFTGSSLLSFFVTSADIIIISRLLGTESAGRYGLVKDLVFKISLLINPLILRVALPFYAKIKQHKALGSVYSNIKELLCYVYVPIYLYFIFYPELVLVFAFGEQWRHLSTLLQILSAWMIIRSVMSQAGSLLGALGLVGRALRWNVFVALVMPIVIYFAAQFGVLEVAVALLVMQTTLYLPHWYFQLYKTTHVSLINYVLSLLKPLIVSAITISLSVLFVHLLDVSDNWQLIGSLMFCIIIYVGMAFPLVKRRYLDLRSKGL